MTATRFANEFSVCHTKVQMGIRGAFANVITKCAHKHFEAESEPEKGSESGSDHSHDHFMDPNPDADSEVKTRWKLIKNVFGNKMKEAFSKKPNEESETHSVKNPAPPKQDKEHVKD